MHTHTLDERRELALPGSKEQALNFAVNHWLTVAHEAIKDHDFFAVALSGGSTPRLIFQRLAKMGHKLDWTKVYLFWSDERSVSPDDPDSNFHMAMEEGGLASLPIPQNQIFRMVAERNIQENATVYEMTIKKILGDRPFDLVMLGMGDDGHTASLFPHTKGLHAQNHWVVANHVPQKETWRMSFTFERINHARHICLYVLGANKAEILQKVLFSPLDQETYPSQKIGTEVHKALWIVDDEASKQIVSLLH